jgi:Uma2 family endonuclease
MAQTAHRVRYSFREYVALEDVSNVKHELADGHIYAMAGGTPEQAALQASMSARLLASLEGGPCRVHASDLRVRVLATGLTTYPDVTVVCGPYERDPEDRNTIVNPRLIVEVLSPRTEEYDRGEKFDNYRHIPSLEEYVVVNHAERRIAIWRRRGGAWDHAQATSGAALRLESVGGDLDVDRVYAAATGSAGE